MKLTLRTFGDPVLREKARPVAAVDDRIRRLALDMLETMYAEEGIGLAAQQVGSTDAIFVMDVPARSDVDDNGSRLNPEVAMPMVLVNPEITWSSDETDVYEEGCLSFPDIRANVERPFEIEVRYLDRDGRPQQHRLRGMVSRCFQHEFDHLQGVLLCDRMSAVKRVAVAGKLKRLRRETREALGLD